MNQMCKRQEDSFKKNEEGKAQLQPDLVRGAVCNDADRNSHHE